MSPKHRFRISRVLLVVVIVVVYAPQVRNSSLLATPERANMGEISRHRITCRRGVSVVYKRSYSSKLRRRRRSCFKRPTGHDHNNRLAKTLDCGKPDIIRYCRPRYQLPLLVTGGQMRGEHAAAKAIVLLFVLAKVDSLGA